MRTGAWPLADPANKKNQLSSRTHDLAGNVTDDGVGHTYTYDAENRVYATGGVTYTYDGDGERVKKSSGMLYWTGTGTAALLETALDGTATAEYVFFNGKRIARIDRPSNATHYYLSDHLGSTAKVTSAIGVVEEWNELGVYGEPISGGSTRYLFTGKERDAGGEDFFGARYYGFRMGRFLTPDWANIPAPIPYSTPGEPQSLNLYSYALNNPVTGTDPDGHLTVEKTHSSGGRLSANVGLNGTELGMGESFGFPDVNDYQPSPAPSSNPAQQSQEEQPAQTSQALSSDGEKFLKREEGKPGTDGDPVLEAYPDTKGNTTIGWGHWVRSTENLAEISIVQAFVLFDQDKSVAEKYVTRKLATPVTQRQFDALVSVAFNSQRSAKVLIKKLNASQPLTKADFIDSLLKGSKDDRGLVNRRILEWRRFSGNPK